MPNDNEVAKLKKSDLKNKKIGELNREVAKALKEAGKKNALDNAKKAQEILIEKAKKAAEKDNISSSAKASRKNSFGLGKGDCCGTYKVGGYVIAKGTSKTKAKEWRGSSAKEERQALDISKAQAKFEAIKELTKAEANSKCPAECPLKMKVATEVLAPIEISTKVKVTNGKKKSKKEQYEAISFSICDWTFTFTCSKKE